MDEVSKKLLELAEDERRIDERIRQELEKQAAQTALDPAIYGRDRRLPRGRTR